MVYQTYNGYVLSQFKKLQADLRNQGEVKWKHVMHLIRLLLAGITVLRGGLRAGARRASTASGCWRSSAARCRGDEVEAWRLELHRAVRRRRGDDEAAGAAGLRAGERVPDQGAGR